MGATADRYDDQGHRSRVVLLGQVSQAATALSNTLGPPSQFSANTNADTPNRSTRSIAAESFIPLSIMRDQSFDPKASDVQSRSGRRSKLAIMCGLLSVTVLAGTTKDIGQFQRADIDQKGEIDRTISLDAPLGSPLQSISATQIDLSMPRLTVHPSTGVAGEPVPLGVVVEGQPDGAVVHLVGLAAGMELSSGRALGREIWEIRATDLGYAWIGPPVDFVGSVDLIAELHLRDEVVDRQLIRLEWLALTAAPNHLDQIEIREEPPLASQVDQTTTVLTPADLPTIAKAQVDLPEDAAEVRLETSSVPGQFDETELLRSPSVSEPKELRPLMQQEIAAPSVLPILTHLRGDQEQITAAPKFSLAQNKLNQEEIDFHLTRGKELMANGDLVAARIVLRRAADANDAESALALAATYDPLVLRELKAPALMADIAMARALYDKAKELGSTVALRRLQLLSSELR
jgi:hypothetical protein